MKINKETERKGKMGDTIDILCMLCGVYLIYSGIAMKVQGKIVGNVVLGKNMNENAIRDKDGFIRYLYLKLVITGVVIILAMVVSIACSYMDWPRITSTIASVLFAAAIVAYVFFLKQAFKKFCN